MQTQRTLADRYLIGRRIGRGGMAEVYAATDQRLGRRVAVKLLHTNLATEPAFRKRFRQEAQAAARMTHPTIVRVFDAGEDTFVRDDGFEITVPYIVMEFIDGDHLGQIMSEGILPPDKIEKYMSGILTSLEYSHRAGVVHRDIKPANIMVTTNDEVKVTDFGIARAISDTAGTIAQTTAILGTASYFSPEQARGETVDGRSDLYSAGIVLYEMLTGRVPFQGDSAVAVAYQHVTEPPRRPSEVNSQVSPALDAVVLKALAKRREDRYQTAAEFRADLQNAFQGVSPSYVAAAADDNPTELFGPGPTAVDATESALQNMSTDDDRAPQVQRRPPAMWIWGAAGLVVAVIIGVLIWVMLLPKEGQLPSASVVVPDVVGLDETEATATLEELGLVVDVETAPSDEVEIDFVMAQTPPPESSIPHGDPVTITVSAGPASISVPNLNTLTEDQAKAALEAVGLTLGSVFTEDSPSVPQGQVIRSQPGGGSAAAPGSGVDIYVSNGQVTIPNFIGENLESAEEVVASLGLRVERQPDYSCVAQDGWPITQQSVQPGRVDQGSTVGLTYCDGTEPDPAPPANDPGDTTQDDTPAPPETDAAGNADSTNGNGNGTPGGNNGNGNGTPGGNNGNGNPGGLRGSD
ncbi:Stk1 family PASTA domain-containing Ser/Thr kinase [Gulosibacter molinativorax]|uniref:non-specific serine/threonine protein kinase n=1 Tax=Gulosibacter molinativorax TaxID=256821 RepID=A0ABT7C7T7_9MICO|nr:Stk1 family PASTA domain-containing Ser/Thr kinase [Gulosibacter molinativorax]